MTHEDATLLLHDLHAGRLGDESRVELEQHLDSCDDCKSFSDFYRTLQSTLKNESRPGDHLDPERIVTCAMEGDVDAHLTSCPTCSEEVERVRRAESSVPRTSDAARTRPPMIPASGTDWARHGALAAGIAIALLAYPAYRGMYRLPQVEDRAEQLQQENSGLREGVGTARVVKLQLVSAPTREGETTATLEIVPGQPHLVLGVQVHIPGSATDSELLQLSLIGEEDDGAVSAELSVGDARQAIRAAGIVTFLVPSDSVRPGIATLRVSVGAQPEATTLFESRLEVVQAP